MLRLSLLLLAFASPTLAEVSIQDVTSKQGLKAWLVEEHRVPFTALEIRFRGGTSLDLPAARGAVKVPVLALHGAADPYVPAKDVAAFQKEMTSAGADWQLVVYGGAAHCFAEPDAASPPGCVYDPKAGGRAMTAMEALFASVW
jgi:dienelactone hydrolase